MASPTPQQIQERFRQATALHQQNRLQEAVRAYEEVLAAAPQHVDALQMLGVVALQSGELQRAVELFGKVLALKPDHLHALINLGVTLQDLRRFDEALAAFERAIALKPDFANAHLSRGNVLFDLARYEEAVASFDRAIALRPQNLVAFHNRGNALVALGRTEEAVASYDRAIALDPSLTVAYFARGGALMSLRRYEDAALAYETVLQRDQRNAAAWIGRGQALIGLTRTKEALAAFEQACALDPNSADAHLGRALALSDRAHLDDAMQAVETALVLKCDLNAAYELRGLLRLDKNQYAEAVADLERAMTGVLSWDVAPGAYVQACTHLCRWSDIEAKLPSVIQRIDLGQKACQPFALMCLTDDPDLLMRCAATHTPPQQASAAFAPRAPGGKIRIGYFSSDFHSHPVAHLIAGLLEQHDRDQFEVFAFALGRHRDAWTDRIEAGADHFFTLHAHEIEDIVRIAREQRLDVAVDLNGYTTGCRPGIFAARVAPVQVGYLGFLCTMSAPFMDYIVADDVIAPPELRQWYSEKIISLPWYQCNEGQKEGAPRAAKGDEHGLPEDGVVFCSFNNNVKLTRDMFDLWMRILKRTEKGVLWLHTKSASADLFREEAAKRGIDPSRLIFAPRVPLQEHLARLRLADLALDTFPYNGGATGANALEAGVPVLTLRGRSFSSRMGASLLTAVGLDDLIADTPEAYENRAVEFASDPARRAELRAKLAENAARQLFNIAAFARNIEQAYTRIVERSASGRAPDHIEIS